MDGAADRSHGPSVGRLLWETVETIVIALVLALLIRHFAIESFVVEGPSMQPTLHSGERVLVNKLVYRLRTPHRGEVIVFKPPIATDKDFIKRVIGEPGDTVQLRQGWVYVNGQRLDEPYIKFRSDDTTPAFHVPEGAIWVLGDHRTDSEDSRVFGEVPLANVKGRALLIWWPLEDGRILH